LLTDTLSTARSRQREPDIQVVPSAWSRSVTAWGPRIVAE